jgi:uncharacterized membrane protein YiaA
METLNTPEEEKINGDNPFNTVPELSLGKNALIYGAILGGISVLYSITLWILGLTLNKPLGYVGIVFTIAVMYYGTKEYRDKHLGGYMEYGKAFTSNFLIGLYSCIIGAVYTFLLFKFIDPSLIDTIKETAITAALQKNPNVSQEQIEQGMSKMSFLMSPAFFTISALVGGAIMSAIVGLIVAFLHKKEKALL